MLKGLAHIAFVVENMEKSLHFYSDILGFERTYDLKDEEGNPWLIYLKVQDNQFIELFYGGTKHYSNPKAAGFEHFCLEVDNINEIAMYLEKHGVLDVKPSQGKDFNYQCWAKDPDGNRIEFMQIDSRSPQSNC